MSTPLKSASNLNISEAKKLETFEIISPSVETSSSSVTIESITAQISSKSSSPFNHIAFKDSARLSPLSEATVSTCVAELNTKKLLKSPISSGTRSPIGSPLLPFLNDTYHHNKQPIQQRENIFNNLCENMLSSSSNNNQQTPPITTTGGTTSLIASNASSPTNSIKNIKCEPFSTLSPLNDSVNSQKMLEETSNNNNANGSNTVAMDTALKRERDCPTTSSTTTTSIMRQNSNSNIKSCPNPVSGSSPTNGSDHSNSSNMSSNLSQAIDNTTDILQDLNHPDKCGNKKKSSLSNLANVNEEGVKPSLDKNGLTGTTTKNVLCTTQVIGSLSSAKEETGGINTLLNVKKEEGNISPDMSPAGFGSISNLSGSNSVDVRSCTPVKQEDVSNTKNVTNCNNNSANSNNNHEKLANVLGSINNNGSSGCAEDSLSASGPTPSLVNTSSDSCVGGSHHSTGNLINSIGSTSSSIANCMDYMQQQNHIFVFSTQLANKGAESVLSGQFPTIIAYHCTQPATKNFLEDFFIKNPMKISKLQRQNTLNLCNISVGSGQQWVGGCNPLQKMSQKPNGNKINFSAMTGNLESKIPLRQSNVPNFNEVSETLGSNENELMCWEQTRSNLEGTSNEGHVGIKMPNGVDGVVGGGPHVGSKSHGTPDGASVNNDNNGTPSLQGIKVPDENLTPQQRQHREEQLAKLKQIDQFLSNPLQGASQLSKLCADGVPGSLAGLMLNLPNTGSASIGPQMSNHMTPNIRNMPSNVMNTNNHNLCNPENMTATLGDGNIGPADMLSVHEINNLTNKTMHLNNQSNMQCGRNGLVGVVGSNVSVGNMSSSHPGSNNTGSSGGNGSISGTSGLMPNSPEIMNNFIGEGNLNSNSVKVMGPGVMHPQDMGQVGMAQMEWSKLQHQFFEERIKSNKGQGQSDVGCTPTTLCRSNSANMRPNISGSCAQTVSSNSCQNMRPTQGPPPPYHPTQRSASVPIATQSPNPASPNNPTSNLSLPSPRTSGALGIPANSPNMDVHVSTMSTTMAVTVTTCTVSTTISNANGQSKNNFPPEGSPTNNGTNNSSTNANSNRNRNNQINQFNSNPSTPLSHLSPKDLDSFHTSAPAGDLKNARPSPQRARTPLMGPNNNNIADVGNMEARFPSASPGLNFSQHMPNAPNSNTVVNSYKGPGQVERQNSAPVPSQFCRRTDNLPLNPNSTRSTQNKLNHSFDPISSLAQMSQQLTSCVSLAGGVGNNGGIGNMGVIGVNDVNVPNNVNQNLESMMVSVDSGLDHSNAGSSGNMGMLPHMSGPGPFMPNNCHINSMLGSMGQRLLNPKMCGGYNPASGGIGRDGPGGLHGVLPNHRMMSRMSMNFSNFNVSPNIQVKASTPNTIQYMPIRAQNNNNNSNLRVPPSLEFLRYANPQMAGAGNIIDNTHNSSASSEQNKINNCNNGPGGTGNASINFFANCNQMGSMDQEDMSGGSLIPGHEMNMGPHSMIRGMRPIRQHMGSQMVPGPRMQAPGVPLMPGHFPNGPQDSMECGDNSMFIANNANGNGPVQSTTQGVSGVPGQGQLYPGGHNQQKPKPMSANNICQNMNSTNLGNNGQISGNANLLPNEQNSSMQSPVNGAIMMSNSGNMLSNAIQVGNSSSPVGCGGNGGNGPGDVGNVGYKPFVGPASNDLKYAQQYHSFQQQLYATSTRSQQSSGNNNIGSNISANSTFFVNK